MTTATQPTRLEPADGSSARQGHTQLDLEHFLPYRLSVLSNRVSQTIADLYQQRFGLAITEWRVMAVLGRYPGLSANEVAERTAMDKVAVSRAVARLLERGLITRDIHADDRRRSVLALSEVGYSVYDEIVPMALGCEAKLVAALDEEERAALDRLLRKLAGPGLAALREG
ncbi:MarR family winged helix-turn-helix transcriptional regulator [Pseudoxanthomonas taiwanensis]|jgi:Transcriptional regulators|uniref:MarR family transcriptional regulator n=1 Tax=Pseudoxanthomonas taiwanensis TaxID=176598 RepID=A0A921NV21_9GAMM|nr:MarR family winged helix-turn-helix transcriptional regulator [Pseudoxanthomonas taiwanensis]KAF1688540.1 MarR family transcriptional regulator [Pseudoxanthomonas taiwanensis]MBO2466975.1 MarR family transcriptional regulator [Xanthomonadaceae bacterium]